MVLITIMVVNSTGSDEDEIPSPKTLESETLDPETLDPELSMVFENTTDVDAPFESAPESLNTPTPVVYKANPDLVPPPTPVDDSSTVSTRSPLTPVDDSDTVPTQSPLPQYILDLLPP